MEVKDLNEMENTARMLVEQLRQKSTGDRATVIGLYGELGAGKTTFVKAVAKAFGIVETVTSPTFVIEKIYKLDQQPFEHLIHIDAYRLESPDELTALGWNDIVRDPKNIIFIEWADKVETLLPPNTKRIEFNIVDEHKREMHIHGKGE